MPGPLLLAGIGAGIGALGGFFGSKDNNQVTDADNAYIRNMRGMASGFANDIANHPGQFFLGPITHLHLHYPLFALELPICTCIALLHLYYSFALALPIICTCITHYLHLHYPLFALALPICTCITHYLHLNYPFALALPICNCICITHYPSIVGINNAHNCVIDCNALRCTTPGMVPSSKNTWSQHRLSRARSARDW